MTESHPYTNRLAKEKSPYLLQHAHNPVDWYAWGPEAFAKAAREEKPIFLSIGYSTCHWCHVMEEESFEDEATAQLLNAHFVPIKVDREERPDVDQIYMKAVMAMGGSGGWPLSVFLTPDLKPFYGGTYFPKSDAYGMPSFTRVLGSVRDAWQNNRAALNSQGENVANALRQMMKREGKASLALEPALLFSAYQQLRGAFDADLGGFGGAPKFPRSHVLSFLLRYWKRTDNAEALAMVTKTLDAMAAGGMFDQLGGGFHRYSVDERWHVPHFEKMLYDQALLSRSYLEAYQITGNAHYGAIARSILDYVLREMTAPEGGFYSAQDADSAPDPAKPREKKEGAVYVWEHAEIQRLLGSDAAQLFCLAYGVEPNGNALNDPHGEFVHKNILFAAHNREDLAKRFKLSVPEIEKSLSQSRTKLLAERAQRPAPHLDDKVLTDWNGLMISSLAYAYGVLGDERYRAAAVKAADFLLKTMRGADGRLLHRYRDGDAAIEATLEDHAFFIHGLLDLFEVTQEARYAEQAAHWTREMIRLFWDGEDGGFFLSGPDAKDLIARGKEVYDGAIPSGNSFAALDLLRLGRLTMDQKMEALAIKVFDAFAQELGQGPSAYPQMLIAADFALGPVQEIVLAGERHDAALQGMLQDVWRIFLPNKIVVWNQPALEELAPFLKQQKAMDGKTTAYVCRQYACQQPVTDRQALKQLLEAKRPEA